MKKRTVNPVDAVAGLMQERQRFESWIAALEAKRSVTPPHVFERVKADYETRLKAVIDQLLGRSTELQDTLGTLTARMAAVQQAESKKRDARFEAELRADVGELSGNAWRDMQREFDEEMGRHAREREAIAAEISRLQQILSMTDGGGGEPRRPTPPVGGGAAEGRSGTAPGGATNARPGGSGRVGGFDELAFLNSVVDPQESANRRGGDGRGQPAAGNATQRPSSSNDAVPPRSPTPTYQTDLDPAPDPMPPEGTPEPAPVPAFLRDVPSEQTRTLKCAECSSMNYPTEWYCERCGAELAAM
ncbi:MAG TPA: hypothetical protein VMM18_11050 [Gemmatimonadaceae bacterium]|nr:hypothetical protein [Gemmatimonadaceae bacterium]